VRRVALVLLTVGMFVGGAPATALVTQPQLGTTEGIAQFFSDQGYDWGEYHSTGQLGSGTFRIYVVGQNGMGCDDPAGVIAGIRLRRSDGMVVSGPVTGDVTCGMPVPATLTMELRNGGRDIARAHLTFRRTDAAGPKEEGGIGFERFVITGSTEARRLVGYEMLDANGRVYGFGGLTPRGSTPVAAVHIEPTASRAGYWVLDRLGRVFAFGDATFLGNARRTGWRIGETAVALRATPSGAGYWVVTNRGRVETFGDAPALGDLRAVSLQAPVVDAVATPTGAGYHLAAADGGVFAFGDAPFLGSMGARPLNRPIVAIAHAKHGGYWLFASDGGVFSFDAPFRGSLGNIRLAQPIVAATRYGNGYVMVGRDGGAFPFSSSPFFGSLAGAARAPVVSVAATKATS
jgi:hypothetical protein